MVLVPSVARGFESEQILAAAAGGRLQHVSVVRVQVLVGEDQGRVLLLLLRLGHVLGGHGGPAVRVGGLRGGRGVAAAALRRLLPSGQTVRLPFALQELPLADAQLLQLGHLALEDALQLDVPHVQLHLRPGKSH